MLTHLLNDEPICHARLVCAGIPLYGTSPATGFSPCTWTPDLTWSDQATDDGDAALVFDTREATFTVWDEARDGRGPYRVSGRLLVPSATP